MEQRNCDIIICYLLVVPVPVECSCRSDEFKHDMALKTLLLVQLDEAAEKHKVVVLIRYIDIIVYSVLILESHRTFQNNLLLGASHK